MAANVRQFPTPKGKGTDSEIPKSPKRPDRADKRTIAAHFDKEAYYEFHKLRIEISQRTVTDITVQDALAMAVRLLFEKFNFEVPEAFKSTKLTDALKSAKRPGCRSRAKASDREPSPT